MTYYAYDGSFSSCTCTMPRDVKIMDLVVSKLCDDTFPPMRLTASGALAGYLDALSWTDDEERYLQKRWCFDGILQLRWVEIRRQDGQLVKVLASGVEPWQLEIFGPAEHILVDDPEPLPPEEFRRWLDYRAAMDWRNPHVF